MIYELNQENRREGRNLLALSHEPHNGPGAYTLTVRSLHTPLDRNELRALRDFLQTELGMR